MIIVWRVTQDCNLACPFCSFDRTVDRPRRNASIAQIEAFGQVLGDYRAATGQDVLVSWIGGEPLLWPPLESLTHKFTRDFGLRISTTTNGTTLGSPAVRRHLLDSYSELTISVDAIGKTHDRLRGWNGAYLKLQDGVRQLSAEKSELGAKLKLRANVVLMRDTFDRFSELCHRLADWGIEEITFNQLGGNDRPDFFRHHRLQPAHARWLETHLGALREALARHGVELRGSSDYLRRIDASVHDLKLPVEDCQPGQDFLFIDETGRIAPCSFTASDYGISIDDLHDAEDLIDLPVRFHSRRRQCRAAPCEDCQSTHVFEKFAPR